MLCTDIVKCGKREKGNLKTDVKSMDNHIASRHDIITLNEKLIQKINRILLQV